MAAQRTGGRRRRAASGDRWELWTTRGTQLLGAAIGAHEAFLTHSDRTNVLWFALALILGPQGVRLVLRGVRGLNGGGE